MIKGKTPEEIRKLFNIVNDFTPEEEVSAQQLLERSAVALTQNFRLKLRRRTNGLKVRVTLFYSYGQSKLKITPFYPDR